MNKSETSQEQIVNKIRGSHDQVRFQKLSKNEELLEKS